jgi:rSAM-associated Gly-rich repeat protein
MSVGRKTKKALAVLLPVGVLGISSALASTVTEHLSAPKEASLKVTGVADRLREIRAGVTEMGNLKPTAPAAANVLVAEWGNFGFGWRNGGWHNWGNGWHNWHNGGWGNGGWGNGWHNGWHNYWHNW